MIKRGQIYDIREIQGSPDAMERIVFSSAKGSAVRPRGWDPGPGPRQFNKLGGVWIFLISRQSWTGGCA